MRIAKTATLWTTRHALLISLALCSTACVSTKTKGTIAAAPEVVRSVERYEKEYLLAPGDQIEVFVYRNPELSRTANVRTDGYISLPLLDEVEAAGLAPRELDARITEGLAKRLVDPEVTVSVNNAREPMVYVLGEAGGAIALPLRQAQTAAQAIAQAGGMKVTAAKGRVAVIRLNEVGELCAYAVDRENLSGQPAFYMALQNTPLQADDLIVIPESNRAQFNRAINDFVATPLGGVNQALQPYFQFKLNREFERSIEIAAGNR